MAKDTDDEATKKLLQIIVESPFMNGGFNRIENAISDIKESQDDMKNDVTRMSSEFNYTKEKIDSINKKVDVIYDPQHGLFTKVLYNEQLTKQNESHINTLNTELTKLKNDHREITSKIKILNDIGGDNFEEIQSTVAMKQHFTKATWLILTGFLGTLGKILWDIFSN